MPKTKSQEEALQGAKERLLEAALDIFGRLGYDAATTRMIAREAGVNIAAIPYYFTGKEGLYRAVIDHIVELISSQLQEIGREVERCSFAEPDAKDRASQLLESILIKMIGFLVGSPEAPRVARIILREQLDPSAAYDRIFSGFMAPSLETLTKLILVISANTDKQTAKIRAMALIGQVIVFRVARETIVRGIGMQGYSPSETEDIGQLITEHTRFILAALKRG